MKTISLNGAWQLTGREQEGADRGLLSLTATVPGCVQLDLSREGYLPADLFMGENIKETEKFEGYEWWYERTFLAPAARENVYIVFEGVDCLAEYYINGHRIGQSENMLIAHEFEIGSYLKEGENTLRVHLSSSVIAANEATYTAHAMMTWGDAAIETALRRAPHTYGWDIMPRAVTAGLWREVRLEVRDEIYFSQLYFNTDAKGCNAIYELVGKWHDLKRTELVFRGSCGSDSSFESRVQLNGKKAGACACISKTPKAGGPMATARQTYMT